MNTAAILSILKLLDKAGVDDILREAAGKITKKILRKKLADLTDTGAVEKVEPIKTGGPGRPAARYRITDIGIEMIETGKD